MAINQLLQCSRNTFQYLYIFNRFINLLKIEFTNNNYKFDKIQFTPGRKKPYSIDLTSASKEAEMEYMSDSILKAMGKFTRITGEAVNINDIPYIEKEVFEEEVNNPNPPYNESEHH